MEYYPDITNPLDATALYLWKAGTARQLPTPVGNQTVDGRAISNGRVAGATNSGDLVGTVWEPNGTLVKPAASDLIVSVNKTGQSVGWKVGSGLSMTHSVWQGATKVGTITGQRSLNVSADDGSVAGYSWNSTTHTQPTYWRCR